MVQLLAGFQLSQALYSIARLGVADCLRDGPRDAAAVAAETGTDAEALRRVMRSLASIGVFAQPDEGLFGLTPLGETLTTGSPASMRDLAITWMETHYQPFGRLQDTIRTGRCAATEFYGQPFFTWLSGQPEQVARFSRAMANLTDGIRIGAISCHDFTDAGRIVDVGGADGAVLAHILAAAPGAIEIGDRRQAIHTAIAELKRGDVLLVAGKGHETGQIVGNQKLPFSDHEVVAAALEGRAA